MAPKPAAPSQGSRRGSVQNRKASIGQNSPPTLDDALRRNPLPPLTGELPTLASIKPSPTPACLPVPLDAVLVDWNDGLVNEKWDNGEGGAYTDTGFLLPSHLQGEVKEWIRPIHLLNPPTDPVAAVGTIPPPAEEVKKDEKRKKEEKKPAAPARKGTGGSKIEPDVIVWSEKDVDESGRTLPKMIVSAEEGGKGSKQVVVPGGRALPRGFVRKWSPAQLDVLAKINHDAAAAGDVSTSPIDTVPTIPDGVEVDPVMAGILRVVEALASSVVQEGAPFLWTNIFPQTPEGKPVYNPGGKYCVKLWAGGKWRKVVVDDRLPVNDEKRVAILSSSEARELWPSILSKALYKLYYLAGAYAHHPDLLTDATSLSGFVTYTLHALTGMIPGLLQPTLNDPKGIVPELVASLQEGGTPVEEIDAICIDHAPWLTLQSNRRGRKKKPITLKTLQKAKEKRMKDGGKRKKLHIFHDEIEGSQALQQAQIDKLGKLLQEASRSQVVVACWIDESSSDSFKGKKVHITPLLAVAKDCHFQEPESDDEGTPPKVIDRYPKVLAHFSYLPPTSNTLKDENGNALHKRVKGDPRGLWSTVDDQWMAIADLASKNPTYLSFHVPGPQLPFTGHHQCHWTISSITGDDGTSKVLCNPLPTAPPVSVYVTPTDGQQDSNKQATLVLGILKDQIQPQQPVQSLPAEEEEAYIHNEPVLEGGEESSLALPTIANKETKEDPWNNEVMVYLQEIQLFVAPPTAASADAVVKGQQLVREPMIPEEGSEEEKNQGQHIEQETSFSNAQPPNSIHLPVRLKLNDTIAFASATIPVEGGKLYRLMIHAPFGASVMVASSAQLQVGDAAKIWKIATTNPATNASIGSVVDETGIYEAILPGPEPRVLLRRVVKMEAFPGPGNTFVELYLKDQRATQCIRLTVINNDTNEETSFALLRTPYLPWRPNNLGYTILAIYVPDAQAIEEGLIAGDFRLLLFSDARIAQPLTKQGCEQLVRYAGSYLPNRHLRLFRDVLSLSIWPVSLRLASPHPEVSLCLRLLDEKTGEELVKARGKNVVNLWNVGLEGAEQGQRPAAERKYIVEAILDAENMVIPLHWTSVRPYTFVGGSSGPASTASVASAESEANGSKTMEWQLSINSASVVNLSHDTTGMKMFTSLRTGWETAMPGRAERAKKVKELVLLNKKTAAAATREEEEVFSSTAATSAVQRIEAAGVGLLNPALEEVRERRRQVLVSAGVMPSVNTFSPRTVYHRPETSSEDGEGQSTSAEAATALIPGLFDDEALTTRLSQHASTLTKSKDEWKSRAADRSSYLLSAAEALTTRFNEVEASRKKLMAQRDALWTQREAFRAQQLAFLAEEKARLAVEEAAAAAAAVKLAEAYGGGGGSGVLAPAGGKKGGGKK